MKQRIFASFLALALLMAAMVVFCRQMPVLYAMDTSVISMDHGMDGMSEGEASYPDHAQSFWNVMPGLVVPFDILLFFSVAFLVIFFFSPTLLRGRDFFRSKKYFQSWIYFYRPPGLLFAFQKGILHPKRFPF